MFKYILIITLIAVGTIIQIQAQSPLQYGYLVMNIMGWQIEMAVLNFLIILLIVSVPVIFLLKLLQSTKNIAHRITDSWQNSSSNNAAIALAGMNWKSAGALLGSSSKNNTLHLVMAIQAYINAQAYSDALKLIDKVMKADQVKEDIALMLKSQVLDKANQNAQAILCLEDLLQSGNMTSEWLDASIHILIKGNRWARIEQLMQNKKYKKVFSEEKIGLINSQKQKLLSASN